MRDKALKIWYRTVRSIRKPDRQFIILVNPIADAHSTTVECPESTKLIVASDIVPKLLSVGASPKGEDFFVFEFFVYP